MEHEIPFEAMHFRNDRYRKERGGQTRMIEISCASCDELLMVYQKDGYPKQHLFRTYLNRIFWPEELEQLQYQAQSTGDMPSLDCPTCHTKVGTPMEYKDGRLAYGLLQGTWKRTAITNQRQFGK